MQIDMEEEFVMQHVWKLLLGKLNSSSNVEQEEVSSDTNGNSLSLVGKSAICKGGPDPSISGSETERLNTKNAG